MSSVIPIVGLIVAILLAFFAGDGKRMLFRKAERRIEDAAALLPLEEAEVRREEWRRHIEDLKDAPLHALVHARRLRRDAARMARELAPVIEGANCTTLPMRQEIEGRTPPRGSTGLSRLLARLFVRVPLPRVRVIVRTRFGSPLEREKPVAFTSALERVNKPRSVGMAAFSILLLAVILLVPALYSSSYPLWMALVVFVPLAFAFIAVFRRT